MQCSIRHFLHPSMTQGQTRLSMIIRGSKGGEVQILVNFNGAVCLDPFVEDSEQLHCATDISAKQLTLCGLSNISAYTQLARSRGLATVSSSACASNTSPMRKIISPLIPSRYLTMASIRENPLGLQILSPNPAVLPQPFILISRQYLSNRLAHLILLHI